MIATAHLIMIALALSSPAQPAQPSAPATLTRLDGEFLVGDLQTLDASEATFDVEGKTIRVPLDEIAEIALVAPPVRAAVENSSRFYLADGGELGGALLDGGEERVVARTALRERTELPFELLAAIRLRRDHVNDAQALFAEALAARKPGVDVLIALDDDGAKALRGRLVSLTPEEGVFVFADQPRRFRTNKVYGVVFAAGTARQSAGAVEVELDGADRVTVDNLVVRDGAMHADAGLGEAWELPMNRVRTLRFRNVRVVYLSELTTLRESSTGIVHPQWPIVRDGNVMRQPMALGGRTFARGFGMHARAEVVFTLAGRYEMFAATIGVDDAACDFGSVEFRVLGDGRELFASGPVSRRDKPRNVRVSIAGVNELSLLVEPGINADVGDWANWADARVILPRKQP